MQSYFNLLNYQYYFHILSILQIFIIIIIIIIAFGTKEEILGCLILPIHCTE